MIHIDGDFPSNKGTCKYHCSPTCHPAQVGPEWVYGCTHKAWYPNRYGDFVPIVQCGGDVNNCDMIGKKFLANYARGLRTRVKNAEKKIEKFNFELNEIKQWMDEK